MACCILVIHITGLYAKDPSPEQLIADHLKSIGDPSTLSQIKSINLDGTAEVHFILGIQGDLYGTAMLVSQGPKMSISMKFQDFNYSGEHLAYDGKSVTVSNYEVGMKSPLAVFIRSYNKIMKNGMIGGVFSRAWPLFDINGNKPRNMKVRKTKVDGNELYEIEYSPRDSHGDMKIHLYFDPETYRHVRTEYKARNYDSGGRLNTDVLTEKFEDFRQVGALTLPHSYTLDFQQDYSHEVFIANWKISAQEITFDAPDIDVKIFNVEQ